MELVKDIIVNLAKAVGVYKEGGDEDRKERAEWQPLPVERFLEDEAESRASKIVVPRKAFDLFANNFSDGRVASLRRFEGIDDGLCRPEEEQGFSRSLVENLLEALETNPLPHLTPNEDAHLLVLIQATLEVSLSLPNTISSNSQISFNSDRGTTPRDRRQRSPLSHLYAFLLHSQPTRNITYQSCITTITNYNLQRSSPAFNGIPRKVEV